MEKTVFISSTFEDLKEYRKKVWEKLSEYEVNIRGMERFGARPEAPLQTCLAEVEQSDIFVGIISYRLGSIDSASLKSFVQLEYEKAYELKKNILIYFIDDKTGKVNPSCVDFGENHDKLDAFKSILKERHTIDTFSDDLDLIEKLGRKFEELLAKKVDDESSVIDDSTIDEYQKSRDVLNKFLLLPKAYSNKEVTLKIKIDGAPFPASKAICKSFYFSYGATIGIKIKIISPIIEANAFNYLFLSDKLSDELLSFEPNSEIEVYASPQFTEESIDTIRAHFVSKTYTTYNFEQIQITSPVSPQINYGPKIETIQAEGQIILQLKGFKFSN